MTDIENRAVVKYLVLKKMKPKEIYEDMLATLEDKAPSYATMKRWASLFKHGRESLKDDPRSGRPSSSVNDETADQVEQLVMNDRRLTVRYLAAAVGIGINSVDTILHQYLRLSKVSARLVPRMLNSEQKIARMDISETLLEKFTANPEVFLACLVTQDETWVPHYDPETKHESVQWKHTSSPSPRKFKVQPSV